MEGQRARFFDTVVENTGGWITPATWDELIQAIHRLRPQISQALDGLEQAAQRSPLSFQNNVFETLQQEKDAYNLTIRLAGFESVGLSSVTSWRAYQSDSQQPESFIETIAPIQDVSPIHVYEDRAIDNDAEIFGDWDRVGGYVTGERVFRQNDQVLSITNVNRTRIESTLGVDLLYYQHEYKSFVLVQYKRMEHETGGFRYRPGSSYEQEFKRMKEFKQKYAPDYSAPNEISQYRLSQDAFYFKLHEGEIFSPLETGLSKGMYIPFDYWETFIDSPTAKGSRGGINVSYDNIGRYLNNTDFITLVKSGWIGSRGSITGIIETIVEPLIAAGRSVTIGVKVKVS